jgi:SAM-dependent methyltransferase
MKNPTGLTKENVFRDTKTWYNLPGGGSASRVLLDFCRQYAGNKILDLGCATGDYCLELAKMGFSCVGADINEAYVRTARARGVEAFHVTDRLPFADKSFDTVLIFEVLEHVLEPERLMLEAKRVAARRILITVPDCGAFELLRKFGLTYHHFLDLDHLSFFTKADLTRFLSLFFERFHVREKEPIICVAGFPWWVSKPVSLLYRMKILKPKIFFRLYAVIELGEG